MFSQVRGKKFLAATVLKENRSSSFGCGYNEWERWHLNFKPIKMKPTLRLSSVLAMKLNILVKADSVINPAIIL